MSEIRDLAYQDYLTGMKYKDIAAKYNISIDTVKSWKTRYNWQREKVCTQNEKSVQKRCADKTSTEKKKTVVENEVKSVMENADLTDKQRLFCIYYIRSFNATKAYQKAYQVDYTTAASIGYRLLENDGVKEEIFRLKQERLNREFLTEADIFQKYMDIAFADITDFVEFGNEDIAIIDDDGQKRTITISHVNVKGSNEVDGTLISEISKGKDGVKVKLADRMKALDWLANHMDMATEEQKARIALLKEKTQSKERDNLPDNMQTLADIILNSKPNRNLEDYE